MSRRYDCSNAEQRAAGVADAVAAVRGGELVVIPTDTVYGIGADAFTPSAVMALLDAKGRGRDVPVPVLVGTVRAASALVEDLGPYGQDLIDNFWPGPLTIICKASRSLNWDLGDSKGTVAVRMPLHAVALELLKETGPMAVSSANRSGATPSTTAAEAEEQLGESVAVYLDGGACVDSTPSTIVDLTTPVPRVLRKGAISVEKLRGVIGYVATDDTPEPAAGSSEKPEGTATPNPTEPEVAEATKPDASDVVKPATPEVVEAAKPTEPEAAKPDASDAVKPAEPETVGTAKPAEPEVADAAKAAEPQVGGLAKSAEPGKPEETGDAGAAKVAPVSGAAEAAKKPADGA